MCKILPVDMLSTYPWVRDSVCIGGEGEEEEEEEKEEGREIHSTRNAIIEVDR